MRQRSVTRRQKAGTLVAVVLLLGVAGLVAGLPGGGEEAPPEELSDTPPSSRATPGPSPTSGSSLTPESSPATADAGDPVDVEPLPPASVKDRVDFGNGLIAVVTRVERVEVEAHQPGETAGPAAAVRLRLRNSSGADVDLGALAVNAQDDGGTPLIPNFSEPTEALAGTLEPGSSRTGVYVFRVDGDLDGLAIHIHHDTTPHFVVIRT